MKIKYKDLKVKDIVRCSDTGTPFADAVVIRVTEQMVTFFRPFIHFSDVDEREDVANPYIGREEFAVYRSETEIEVLRRGDENAN